MDSKLFARNRIFLDSLVSFTLVRITYILFFLFSLFAAFSAFASSANEPIISTFLGASFNNDLGPSALHLRNSRWTTECAKRTVGADLLEINTTLAELCKLPNSYYTNPVKFQISNEYGSLTMKYKIHFQVASAISDNRASEMLSMAKTCLPQIQEVWARYGVFISILMDSNRDPDLYNVRLPENQVVLLDSKGRSNATTFYVSDQDSLCRSMVHEVGHHFGLEDEYAEKKCPDRPFISKEKDPYSIMAKIWGVEWNNMDFHERHIRKIFVFFCYETTTHHSYLKTRHSKSSVTDSKIELGSPE